MIAVFATAALVVWLLLGEPLAGRWSYRRMLAGLDAGSHDARLHFYRSWIWQAWLLAGITLAAAWGNGWTLASLGLRPPHMPENLSVGFVVGIATALVGGAVLGRLLARHKKNTGGGPRRQVVAGGDTVLRILPRGTAERRSFAVLAITAGLTEELIWRGFGLAVLRSVWPHGPLLSTLVVLALTFGWAHFYQGVGGMFATAVIGGLMAWLYFATGSLLLPMLLHVLLDLRALLLSPGLATNLIEPTDRQWSPVTEKHP